MAKNFQKAERNVKIDGEYKLLSYASSSESVEMTDGTDLQTKMNSVDKSISDETTRAKGSESTLTTNLNSEISRAKSAESTLTTNLNSEITRAQNAENTLSTNKLDKTTVASSSTLGLIKSGTDITVDTSGNVSVNDNSHKHTVSNISDLTATASELNVLDGITATTQELNYVDGVTSNIQTQLNSKSANGHTHDDRYYTESEIDTTVSDINDSISSHTSNTSNPHSVTKAQVGLGNVENKSSATIRGEITKSNVTTALGYTPLNQSLKGSASGLAELDSNGKVPSSQLPSFVDDVVEGYLSGGKFYKESAHTTEISGETGKIYIDLSTEKTYRWSGSAFVVISETLALGETSSTAYRGDRGKTAYDHSQSTHARTDATKVEKSSTNGNIKINGTETTVYTHPSGTNPHGTTKSDVGLGNVGNFKAVSTVASQGLSDAEKANARANIGAGTSSFSGSYNDLTNKPTIPTVGNGTITITQNGTTKGTFTTNQSGNTTIELTDNNTTYGVATQSANGLESAADKKKLDGIATGAEVNQNAFSNVVVGSTTISADSATDTLTLVAGSNVTITPDATNDKITISATDTNTWRPLGTTADTACAGNDSRLSNARPASDVYSWAKASSKPSYSWSEINNKPSIPDIIVKGHDSDHTNYPGDNSKVPNMEFMSYWNGAYDIGGDSNLRYCAMGAFGNIVTLNKSDVPIINYLDISVTHTISSSKQLHKIIDNNNFWTGANKIVEYRIYKEGAMDYWTYDRTGRISLDSRADGLYLDILDNDFVVEGNYQVVYHIGIWYI